MLKHTFQLGKPSRDPFPRAFLSNPSLSRPGTSGHGNVRFGSMVAATNATVFQSITIDIHLQSFLLASESQSRTTANPYARSITAETAGFTFAFVVGFAVSSATSSLLFYTWDGIAF